MKPSTEIGNVAPLVGAWIEIPKKTAADTKPLSLPLWERGLKLMNMNNCLKKQRVAPLVGAWIEICCIIDCVVIVPSLPLWERGLKFMPGIKKTVTRVAPLVGAWIEI